MKVVKTCNYKRDNLGQGYTPNVSKYGGWMQQTII